MKVINSNPTTEVNPLENKTKSKALSKTDAKVSKIAKGFFASIGAFIAAPFKFIAKIIKSGFMALTSLAKKEKKNQPSTENKIQNPAAQLKKEKEVAHKEVQTEANVLDQEVQTEANLLDQGVQVGAEVAEEEIQTEANVLDQGVQVGAEVAEEEVQDDREDERFNSFSAFVGAALLGASFIPMTANMFTASYNGDTFAKVSLPMCYPNESFAFRNS